MALILWAILGIQVISYTITYPGKRTVTPNYWEASANWIKGNDLYSLNGTGFLYMPQSAIINIPFTYLPFTIAEVVWRAINISLYALSCYLIASLFESRQVRKTFLIISAFAVPLAYSSARNGQLNLTLAALIGIVTFCLAKKYFKLSIIICIFGTALKPYMAVPLLLLNGVYPKRCLPISFLGLTVLFFAPFLFQSSTYVWHQYSELLHSLKVSMQFGHDQYYAYLFGMLKVFKISINSQLQIYITLCFALAVFILSLHLSKKGPETESPIFMMTLATTFILLFSSRSENNSYCLIGSFLAFFFLYVPAVAPNNRKTHETVILLCYTAIIGSHEIGKYITPGKAVWLAPLGLTIFISYIFSILIPILYKGSSNSAPLRTDTYS